MAVADTMQWLWVARLELWAEEPWFLHEAVTAVNSCHQLSSADCQWQLSWQLPAIKLLVDRFCCWDKQFVRAQASQPSHLSPVSLPGTWSDPGLIFFCLIFCVSKTNIFFCIFFWYILIRRSQVHIGHALSKKLWNARIVEVDLET